LSDKNCKTNYLKKKKNLDRTQLIVENRNKPILTKKIIIKKHKIKTQTAFSEYKVNPKQNISKIQPRPINEEDSHNMVEKKYNGNRLFGILIKPYENR
jgi:hypothetical protein